LVRSEGLVLNEIGARHPDFLEFYHSGSAPLQLGSYAVSDDSTGRIPYALPFQMVNPGERKDLVSSLLQQVNLYEVRKKSVGATPGA
jgi:hypothetical protein